MEDSIADILAERSAMESGATLAVFLSVAAHAGLTALALWAAWHHPPTQRPALMNIQFAQVKPIAAATSKPAAPVEPVNRPAPQAVTPAPQAVAPPKKVVKPVLASPFGRSTKKETPAPPVPAPAAPAVTDTQPEVVLEGGDFPYTLYIDRMKTLVGTRWFRPQSEPAITATLYFVIDRDGTIRDLKIETSSGNGTFDRAAMRAVLESSPLPPLPFGYSGTYLGVHLTFR